MMIGVPLAAMADLGSRTGQAPGFGEGFVFAVVLMAVLNVYALVVIDWWRFCTLRPPLFVLPGTEDMPSTAISGSTSRCCSRNRSPSRC